MNVTQKQRIDRWIETQKTGTDAEIAALPNLQDFCGQDDKPYLIKNWLPVLSEIEAHQKKRYTTARQSIENQLSHEPSF